MFHKVASIEVLGTATFEGEGLKKVAFSSGESEHARPKSYYIDGARKLDVRGLLKEAAEKYDISADPSDYIFEAIRANSTNVPNENHDGFHRDELLRFDTKLKKPVYVTYIGKPHHMNHKTDDPKRARGVIVDSHYNEDAPPFELCPKCTAQTFDPAARDPSGIHCAKCGEVVKDEFVEILVAVDTKKDPDLVRGIQAGILNAGSMGCNCSSTVCNVCHHVARSVNDFCEHIRGASKGSLWQRRGSKFERISPDKVRAIIKDAGWRAEGRGNQLVSVSLVIPERDFEVRKAFEYCQGVEFEEYSRVHRPADPKARTVELLKVAEASDQQSIEEETRQLIIRAQLARMENTMSKAASKPEQTFYAVRVNGNDEDIHVAASLEDAVKAAALGRRDRGEYFTIEASSETVALSRAIKASLTKKAQYLPMQGDVNLVVPDGVKVHLDDTGNAVGTSQNDPNAPMAPGSQAVQPGQPNSIEDVTQQEISPEDPQQSPEEFGMLPPGASASTDNLQLMAETDAEDVEEDNGLLDMSAQKYAAVYGDFQVEVFEDKAVVQSPGGDVFTVKASKKLESPVAKQKFGGELIDSVLSNGLVRTAMKFGGSFSKRVADATEGAMFNFAGGRPMSNGGALEGAEFAQAVKPSAPANTVTRGGATDGYDDDMKDVTRPMPTNSIESRDTNMADGAEVASPKTNATDGAEFAMKEKPATPKQDALGGASTDMKANAGGSKSASLNEKDEAKTVEERLKKLYASRLEKAKADFEAELELVKTAEREKIFRALRIAQRRAALNIEESPLKTKMVDSLTVARPIGRSASTGESIEYSGLQDNLALHLVEAAWSESAGEEVESLINRAAELLSYDDKYLVSAEKDLAKQAAIIPQVVEADDVEPVTPVQSRAASLRQAALNGNLTLAPETTDSGVSGDRLELIRSTLSLTKVGQLQEQLRAS